MIIMVFSMSVIMSGVVATVNMGTDNGFLEKHFNSFIFTFPVTIITAFTMAPITKTLVNRLTSKN